ncbi:MAG: aminodeoxychorismate synthase component I [Gemmatimonadaceae bacterium]|nr:aminodeoxychorismate synthase component I [Gemmatimonadaceae bacterium]
MPPGLRPPPEVWLHSDLPGRFGRSFRFSRIEASLQADEPGEVTGILKTVEAAVGRGLHAVGFLCYEAAPAFDPAFPCGPRDPLLPLVWFGLYGRRREISAADGPPSREYRLGPWKPGSLPRDHAGAVRRIHEYIAAGDTYQVNYTFPLSASFEGDAGGLYRDLRRSQGGAGFCAFLDLGRAVVVSASPELFFSLDSAGGIEARPMKGTRRRGRWVEEDDDLARELTASAKERAENVMIVDLLRNDLGRVSVNGSVRVPRLWRAEALDTVWQMTSTVTAKLRDGVGPGRVFEALFPCGSVTGAPKVRTTQIIRELEGAPRGVYTGSIGYLSPEDKGAGTPRGMEVRFSVAIRTVTLDRCAGIARAGVGAGITWGSEASSEYGECLAKARFLTPSHTEFELLEGLLFEPDWGYYLLERHLRRLEGSARYFGFPHDEARVRARLAAAATSARAPLRVRLTMARDGALTVESSGVEAAPSEVTAVIAEEVAVDEEDRFLYHKTTHPGVREEALVEARRRGAREAVLLNQRGEIAGAATGNLLLQTEAGCFTPPLASGILPGTMRAELLAAGEAIERRMRVEDLVSARAVYRIDSVRRRVRLRIPDVTHHDTVPIREAAVLGG